MTITDIDDGLLSGLFIIIGFEPLNLMELDGSSLLPDEF